MDHYWSMESEPGVVNQVYVCPHPWSKHAAIAGPGDNVAYVSPVWPNIVEAVRICGGTPRPVELDATPDGGWRLDLQKLFDACDDRTRGIFVASPGNPTGWMLSAGTSRLGLPSA